MTPPGLQHAFLTSLGFTGDGLIHNKVPVPTWEVHAGTVLHRIHRAENSALYYSRSGSGRFDPPATSRDEFGTCYLALDRLGAFVEVFGRTNPISETAIAERILTEVALVRPLFVADLTARSVLGRIGPIPEISVGPDYHNSAAMASQLVDQGFDAIRYFARHDPAFTLTSVAVFSTASDALQVSKSSPIPDDLVAEAEREFELLVIPQTPLD